MASTTASELRLATHALNRAAFGPRPGEAERAASEGVDCWIERQVAADDPEDALRVRLEDYPAATFTARQIFAVNQTALALPPVLEIYDDFCATKIVRAVHAQNQLAEVMTDFWANHFNVWGPRLQHLMPDYEREAIRPHALGRFRDLLLAVARHPAMLYYLDNYLSTSAKFVDGNLRTGLNENYGRELLELHTVGVDAGYTQRDVVDAARAFTGWGIEGIHVFEPQVYVFCYRDERHDHDDKSVFGFPLPAGGGKEDGELLLDHLAAHPATARFVSRRLVERFVSDDPPGSLVSRAASVFHSSGGDIQAVMLEILRSPEFRSAATFGAKVKTPLEFAASAVRALDLEVRDGRPLASCLAQMGMPLYGCKPPTGYSNRGRDWLNPGTQTAKFDLAFKLADGRLPGVGVGAGASRADDQRAAALRIAAPAFQTR